MSRGNVEYLHIRLKEELERLSLSMAEAARLIGEDDSQSLRDACGGRKRLSAELLARLQKIGVDALYVLDGKRMPSIQQTLARYRDELTPDETEHLNKYRNSTPEGRAALRAAGNALAQAPPKMTKTVKGK